MERTTHMVIARSLVIRLVREHGPRKILGPGFKGTKAQAIAALEADTRKWMAPAGCTNVGPDGACQGCEVRP